MRTLGVTVHLYTDFQFSAVFIVMMVPYASMATSGLLAAASPCQDATTDPLKADPCIRTSGESYATPYNTCRFHQESQARSSTRRPPLLNCKNIPRRSTWPLTMKNVLADWSLTLSVSKSNFISLIAYYLHATGKHASSLAISSHRA
jgi:hypothetical protein